MLESIHVKNVALIEEAEVEFQKGLNILTGETGAGKSILLGSVQLALGAKSDKGLIRNGAEYALAQLLFSLDEEQKQRLLELGIDAEDNMLILERKVYPGKSICKMNGELVTGKILQQAAEILIDIHGQREHQSILKEEKQQELLDTFCKEKSSLVLDKLSSVYQEYKTCEKRLQDLREKGNSPQKEIDFAKFELEEIEDAAVKVGEDEELELSFKKISSAQSIVEHVSAAKTLLEDENGQGAFYAISMAAKALKEVSSLDESAARLTEQLSDAQELVRDCVRELENFYEQFQFSGEQALFVEERLNLYNRLKNKYGNSVEAILAYKDSLVEKIEELENFEAKKSELEEKLTKLKAEYMKCAKELHEIRCEAGKTMSAAMQTTMTELNFQYCQFQVHVEFREEQMSEKGSDRICFMISLNQGEPLKEMAKIASGGELSRIMLAQKVVFADKEQIGTLIFDEIDAGISGQTAWKVSEKLALLCNNHQVICITHLAQIAAMADTHFVISKESQRGFTSTNIQLLKEDEQIREIGRLLGTNELTEAVLVNAREMKDLAEKTKQSQSKTK